MALAYDLYTGLSEDELGRRLRSFTDRNDVAAAWTRAVVRGVSALQQELRREEGFADAFTARASIRLAKDDTVGETRLVSLFYRSLPTPKAALFNGEPTPNPAFAPDPVPDGGVWQDDMRRVERSGSDGARRSPAGD